MSQQHSNNAPKNINPLWVNIANNLPGSFWWRKGLSGQCPFCHKESAQGAEKFLVRFVNGSFKGYNCFSCEAKGRGTQGIMKLARHIGIDLDPFEAASLSGESDDVYTPSEDPLEEGRTEELSWPPDWLNETDEVVMAGIQYLEKRGIPDVENVIVKYDIHFSTQVLVEIGDWSTVKPYPCIVAPMVGANNEIIGWTTRRIENDPTEKDPKSIARGGTGWKERSIFGIREIDPTRPVSIVEGFFSSISTPNSVATAGKDIQNEQLKLLAASGARMFVFALDPAVNDQKIADYMVKLLMMAPGSKVCQVEWEKFGGYYDDDPNDRGFEAMTNIVRTTVLSHLNKTK
jgi:hypothetical protein